MTDTVTGTPAPATSAPAGPSPSELYQRATKLNAKLASRYDASTANEARQVAQALIAAVKSQAKDYEAFVQRVERSEQFSLHESAQVEKEEKQLKTWYLRATDLLVTLEESERFASSQKR